LCKVILYNLCKVILYNLCRRILYNLCRVILYNLCRRILYNLCKRILYKKVGRPFLPCRVTSPKGSSASIRPSRAGRSGDLPLHCTTLQNPLNRSFPVKQIFDCVAINPRGTTCRQRHNQPATHPINGEGNNVAERLFRLNQVNPRGTICRQRHDLPATHPINGEGNNVAERFSRLNQALPRGKVRRPSPILYDAAKPVEQVFSVKQFFDCVGTGLPACPRGTTCRQRHNPPATHPTNGEGNDAAERFSRLNQALPRGKVRRPSPTLYDVIKPAEQVFSVKQFFDCVGTGLPACPRGTTYRQRHNPPATHPINGEGNNVAERVSRLNQAIPRGKVRSG
jgi:hypothetical protein